MHTIVLVLSALVGGYVVASSRVSVPRTTRISVFAVPTIVFVSWANRSNNRSYPFFAVVCVLSYGLFEGVQAAAVVFATECLGSTVLSASLTRQSPVSILLGCSYLAVAYIVSSSGGLIQVEKQRELANNAIEEIDNHFDLQNQIWVELFIVQVSHFRRVLDALQSSHGMSDQEALSLYTIPRGQGPLTHEGARTLMQRFESKCHALGLWNDLSLSYDEFPRPR